MIDLTQVKEEFVHKFELAGLGQAPFKFVMCYTLPSPSLAEHNPEAYRNALAGAPHGVGVGTCHYCGHAIMVNFIIRSADGKLSSVGCECIKKVGDHGLMKTVNALKAKERKEKKRIADAILQEKRTAEALARWEAEAPLRAAKLQEHIDRNNKIREENAWLYDRLQGFRKQGGFVDSICIDMMGSDLENIMIPARPLQKFPPKAVNILCDIYCKSFGRSGSKDYIQAEEFFNTKYNEVVS